MKIILSLLTLAFLPLLAHAAPATYSLLSPLGTLTGAVTLGEYLQGIIQVVIGVAGILAVVMMVICGVQMMGTPSASQKSKSKECIMNAIYGLILALSSWVILATINTDLLRNDANIAPIGTPASVTLTTPPGTFAWSTIAGTCPPVAGQIVSTVPSSYCTGSPALPGAPCCGYSVNPLPQPVATPVPPPGPPPPPLPPPPTPITSTVYFETSTYFTNEGGLPLYTITVLRSSGVGSGSVKYTSASLSAKESLDYTPVSGIFTFAPGETSKTFTIKITDDIIIEQKENFALKLTNPMGSIGLGVLRESIVRITDNDSAGTDTVPPVVTIIDPVTNSATTSPVVNIKFTASDVGEIYSINITYAPPAPNPGMVIEYCKIASCANPTSDTYVLPFRNDVVGNHKVQISVCDTAANCRNTEVIITVQPACTSCLPIPIGKNGGFPLCETNQPSTPGRSGIAVGTGTHAYEFLLTAPTGGGKLYFAGGFENEYPPPPRYSQRQCFTNICASDPMNPSCQCIYGVWEYINESFTGDCITYQPPNLAISISDYEDDLSSTPNTIPEIGKSVSGNCGTAGTGPQSTWEIRISTVAGPGVCKVEVNRKYYVNVSTYPFVPVNGINPVEYSMYWDFSLF